MGRAHRQPQSAPAARKPMAGVRRVSLFEREIRIKLSGPALEILFDLAAVISEGQLAKVAIRETIARYNLAGDGGRLDELAACFAPDGVLLAEGYPDFDLHGREAIVERLQRVRSEGGERRGRVRHHLTTSGV